MGRLNENLCSLVLVGLGVAPVWLAGCGGDDQGPPRPGSSRSGTEPATEEEVLEVSLQVDPSERFQTLEGFGAAVAWYGGFLSGHPHAEELYELLFVELGADILRLRNSWGREAEWDLLSAADIVRGASEALGHPPKIQMSSWSPPRSIKDNDHTECTNLCALSAGEDCSTELCTLKKNDDGAFMYAEFADYWHDSLVAYAELGVVPDWISIQNEPDFTPRWEGCRFTPNEADGYAGYAEALAAVHERLSKLESPPKLLGPETLGVQDDRVLRYTRDMDFDHVDGIAHHLYEGESWRAPDVYNQWLRRIHERHGDLPIFQTEFGEGGPFEMAWLIHNSLVEGNAAAYLYWELIWVGENGLISLENPRDQENWQTERGYQIREPYHAMRHFSRFTDPGYVRVGVESSNAAVRASAYLSPAEDVLTLVFLNVEGSEREVRIDLGDFADAELEGYWSNESEFWQPIEEPELDAFALPGRSIVTISARRD